MATATSKSIKDVVFEWEGKDRNGKQVRGETRAVGENQVLAALRRQGVVPDQDQEAPHERRASASSPRTWRSSRASWPP